MTLTERAPVGHACTICDRTFNLSGHLTRHMRTHTKDAPFKCTHPGCTSSFQRSDNLRRHAVTHAPADSPFVCKRAACARKFQTKQNLDDHVARMHNEPVRFACADCDADFAKKRNLNAHRAEAHGKQKPCPCTEAGCDEAFLYPSQLRSHLLAVHTEKSYMCMDDSCQQLPAFTKFSDLQRHMRRVHAPKKNLQCEDCGKKFRSHTGLKKHRATHKLPVVDRLSFKCSFSGCDSSFTSSSNLGTHVRSKHVQQHRFVCETCLKTFNLKSSLKRHVLNLHAEADPKEAEERETAGRRDEWENGDEAEGDDSESVQSDVTKA